MSDGPVTADEVAGATVRAQLATCATADAARPYRRARYGAVAWLGPADPLPDGWRWRLRGGRGGAGRRGA